MRPSSPIGGLVPTLRQWLTAQRQIIRGMTGPDTSPVRPADSPAVIHYEGWHGILSRCHVIHRRHGNRILFAFGIMEDGGTSPTNMVEEPAAAMWKRFYRKDRFDCIDWFDAWPEHYSLTNRFHIQRVDFRSHHGESGPVWPPGRDMPKDFVKKVRRVIDGRPNLLTAGPAMADGVDHG